MLKVKIIVNFLTKLCKFQCYCRFKGPVSWDFQALFFHKLTAPSQALVLPHEILKILPQFLRNIHKFVFTFCVCTILQKVPIFRIAYAGKCSFLGVWYMEREHFPCTLPPQMCIFWGMVHKKVIHQRLAAKMWQNGGIFANFFLCLAITFPVWYKSGMWPLSMYHTQEVTTFHVEYRENCFSCKKWKQIV